MNVDKKSWIVNLYTRFTGEKTPKKPLQNFSTQKGDWAFTTYIDYVFMKRKVLEISVQKITKFYTEKRWLSFYYVDYVFMKRKVLKISA